MIFLNDRVTIYDKNSHKPCRLNKKNHATTLRTLSFYTSHQEALGRDLLIKARVLYCL